MAVGSSDTRLDDFLSGLDAKYIQFHTGDPGSAGTANASAVTNRKQVTLETVNTNGTNRRRRNSALIRWDAADVTGTATLTHFSMWSASTGGTFLMSAALTSSISVANGTPIEIAINQLEFAAGPRAS